MAEDTAYSIDDLKIAVGERWATRSGTRDRAFMIGLCGALFLHSLFLLGFLRTATPRVIGDESGSQEAIGVSLISDAEFKAKFAQEAANAPAGPVAPPTPAPQPPPQPEQAEAKPAPAEPPPPEPAEPVETAAVEPPPPEPVTEPQKQPEPPKEPAPEAEVKSQPPPAELAPTLADDMPELLTLPSATKPKPEQKTEKKTEPDKPKPKPRPVEAKPETAPAPPRQKQAALDLSPPSTFRGGGGFGGAAGVQRPPGITRAGWNDAFARAVIAALRATMPQLRDTRGRVTVRILLNENGNIKVTDVVRPSQVGGLDQSVVFATKQTNYPLPPLAATEADRTFLITYIYE